MADDAVWRCDCCAESIDDGTGYLCAEYTSLRASQDQVLAHRADRQRDTEFCPANLTLAPWRAVHFECDPDLPDASYAIEIHRIRNSRQALWWTLHLSGKGWFESTDWYSAIKAAGLTDDLA